ncbi:MAG TPA: transporter, partial [Gammaproteobacteria bacterium]|nr:transporter [Gammaproteobacteria bacterium]
MVKHVLSFLLVLTVSGCVLGPDHVRPDTDLPSGWAAVAAQDAPEAPIDPHWWRRFDDPVLTALIEEAL